MAYKLIWIVRYILFRPFFGSFLWPGYLGRPTVMHGMDKMYFGSKVRIYPGARFEAHGTDARIYIGDNVGIAQNVHITAGGSLAIGSGTAILANTFVTDIEHIYAKVDVPILEQPVIIRETKIGKNCFIGMGAAIQAGTILGDQCIVGANSVVRGTFPSYCVIAGAPARILRKYDSEIGAWPRVDPSADR